MPRAGELIVRLKKAKKIKGDEAFVFGKADLFANLSLGGEKRTSKVVIEGGSGTVWNEEFRFKIAAHVNIGLYESLRIFIYHQGYFGDMRLGTAKIDVKNLLEEHEDEVPNREYPVIFHGQKRGGLVVGFTFKPVNGLPVVEPKLTTFDIKGPTSETFIDRIINFGYRKPKKYALVGPQGLRAPPRIKKKKGEDDPQRMHQEHDVVRHEEAYSMDDEEEKHTEWASESESEYESVQSPPWTREEKSSSGKKRTVAGCSIF